MELDLLILHNFGSYQHEKVVLRGVGVAAVIGGNGTGKSTLFEAVEYACFGESRAKTDDELSYGYDIEKREWKVDNFYVKLKFKINGVKYNIVRTRSQSGTSLKFGKDGEFDLTASTLKETQKNIENVIGIDHNSFIASVMLKQNQYDALMDMSPSEAKKVLMRIIGISDFEQKADKVKKAGNAVEIEHGVAASNVTSIKEQLESVESNAERIKGILKTKETLQEQLDACEVMIEKLQADYLRAKDAYEKKGENYKRRQEIQDEIKQLNKKLRDVENDYEEALDASGEDIEKILNSEDKFDGWLDAMRVNIETCRKDLALIIADESTVKQKIRGSDEKIEELRGNKSVCLMNDSKCNIIWKEKIKKQIEQTEEKKKELEQELERVLEGKKVKTTQLEKNVDKEKRIKAAKEVLLLHSQMETIKDSIKKLEREKEGLEGKYNDTELTDDEVDALRIRVRDKKKDRDDKTTQISEISEEIGKLKAQKDRKETLEKELAEQRALKKELSGKKLVYDILYKAFSKDGIPALMIENIIPVLEQEANDVLDKLSNGKIQLEFRLQKKLKGGGFSDSFEIFVMDDKGTRSLNMYSGGERFRIIFAIHFSFALYLTKRSGTNIKFIVIDEPAGLDTNGIESLIEVLSTMKKYYKQIFVISHLKELVDSFPQTIYVQKTLAGSKVTIRQESEDEI